MLIKIEQNKKKRIKTSQTDAAKRAKFSNDIFNYIYVA